MHPARSRTSYRTITRLFGLALGLVIIMPGSAGAEAPSGTTINTYKVWNGEDYVAPFGNPNTTTYGQVVTIPRGCKKISAFSFWMASEVGAGTMKVRGEVYAWDGDSATGTAVWESKTALELQLEEGDPTYQKVTFRVGKPPRRVMVGRPYVFFGSVSKDYEQSDPNVLARWGANYFDALPGGDAVFLNDTGDESQWTTQSWTTLADNDFAVKIRCR